MSKLFDQLKQAERARVQARGDAPEGLLSQALQRAAADRSGDALAAPPSPLAIPAAPSRHPAAWSAAVGVAAFALGVAVASWHFVAGPQTRDAHRRAAPAAGLKLDYQLDLTRTGASGRSSLPGPDPSR